MTSKQPHNLSPFACFVVQREPGKGYRVASAEGPSATDWEVRALGLLDAIGQPDPNGPTEYFRWIGPIAPAGEYVGVAVKLLNNGEARYHQSWFRTPKPMSRPTRSVGLLIAVSLLFFTAGVLAARTFFVPGVTTTSGPIAGDPRPLEPVKGKLDPPEKNSPPDGRGAKLRSDLATSREVRTKLKGFLSQEGFAADTSIAVVDEKRSVKLIADLDKIPPPQESIRLSNIEVANLLRLLDMLNEWTSDPKQSPKSE